jgi:hypothetical protein
VNPSKELSFNENMEIPYHEQFFIGKISIWWAMVDGNKPLFGSSHPKSLHFRHPVFNQGHAQELIDSWGHSLTISLVEDWRYTIYDCNAQQVGWMYYRPYKSIEKHVSQGFPLDLIANPEGGNLFKYIEDAERNLAALRTHFEQTITYLVKSTKETQGALCNLTKKVVMSPEALAILNAGLPAKKRSKKVVSLADFLETNPLNEGPGD